jgi:hypothetical protein
MVQTRSQSLSQNNQINMALPTGTGDSRDQDEVHSACEDQSVVAESVHVGDREADLLQSIAQSLQALVSMRGGSALSSNEPRVAETRRRPSMTDIHAFPAVPSVRSFAEAPPVPTLPVHSIFNPLNSFHGFGFPGIAPLNIHLPLLQSETALEGHLRRVLILLSEYRLVNNGKIIDGYNFSVLSLVVETFRGVPAVYSEAQYQVEVGVGLSELSEILLSQFCHRSALYNLVREQLSALKLERPYSRYISNLRSVYRLHQRVFSRDENISKLIDHILLTVPRAASRKLGKELQAIDPIQWQTALPFDSHDGGKSILSILSAALAEEEIVEDLDSRIKSLKASIHPSPTNTPAKTGPIDRAKRSFEEQTKSKVPWLEEWVKKFKKVYKCWGDGCFEQLKNLDESFRQTTGKGEVKFIRSRGYAFVGINEDLPSPLACQHKEFVLSKGTSQSKN